MSSRTFRVWAPRAGSLALRIRGEDTRLRDPDDLGWYEVEAEGEHGDNYFYVVDGEELPDPWSRWQPDGIRGPSRVPAPRRPSSVRPRGPSGSRRGPAARRECSSRGPSRRGSRRRWTSSSSTSCT